MREHSTRVQEQQMRLAPAIEICAPSVSGRLELRWIDHDLLGRVVEASGETPCGRRLSAIYSYDPASAVAAAVAVAGAIDGALYDETAFGGDAIEGAA